MVFLESTYGNVIIARAASGGVYEIIKAAVASRARS
jgi:hypothetical protein